MKGLELARAYYKEYGEPMLREKFPELLPRLAVGLCGSGSECWGFDDVTSRDHDFEPGFCIFLPGEEVVDRKAAFALERAYAALPREFRGFKRSLMSPVGGARHGVIRMSDFWADKIGKPDGQLSLTDWLYIPDYALAEAVNGEIFMDGYGEMTEIRERLRRMPEDVRLKKLAGQLLLMAQSGQYNYRRCLAHGETGAAQLAVCEFVKSSELLEYLLTTDNETETSEEKSRVIEGIAEDVIAELRGQGLTQADCGDLEKHAYSVNDHIADGQIRNMHVLAAV